MVVTRRNNARIAPAMPRKKLRVTKPVREFFQELGRRGGSKGGRRAALNMTPEERHERAVKAAQARWTKAKKRKR